MIDKTQDVSRCTFILIWMLVLSIFGYVSPVIADDIKLLSKDKAESTIPAGKTYTDPFTGMELVNVEGGCFQMGSNDYDNEKPIHQVCVRGFYLGKYEVTQAQWEKVMGNNPSQFKGADKPVEQVSWKDVQDFIDKLNRQTGNRYRLPTEAEWEFAAKGGKTYKGGNGSPVYTSKAYKYSGSNNAGDVAWHAYNSGNQTHHVGQKQPNELDLFDMSGNVYEWVQDWHDSYSSGSQINPQGPNTGVYRVAKGGSWRFDKDYARPAFRDTNNPDVRVGYLGFRLALGQ